ncbi:MAG: DUF3575 domain-containing protein [Bacteroidales bacterium]|nr:DUF3575 domain-containing protein [Bacteroidales bacterium]
MKNYLLTLVFALSSTIGIAQFEIKTDLLGLTYQNYGLGYELILNDNMSVALYSNFTIDATREFKNNNYTFSKMKMMPEFRYYFKPKYGGDGIFFGGYALYISENSTDLTYIDFKGNKYKHSLRYEGHGLGLITGYKLLTKSRFYFEGLAGVGRITPYHIVLTGLGSKYVTENYYYENNLIFLWDLRLEFIVGFRIGKMKQE